MSSVKWNLESCCVASQPDGCHSIMQSSEFCRARLLWSYFISHGEECPEQIRGGLKLPSNTEEVNEEESDVQVALFCNILSIFEEIVKKLERNNMSHRALPNYEGI